MKIRNEMKFWQEKEARNEQKAVSECKTRSERNAENGSASQSEKGGQNESGPLPLEEVRKDIHPYESPKESAQQDSSAEIAKFIRETYGVIHVHEHYCQENHEQDFDPEKSYYGQEHYFQTERNAMTAEKC